MQIPPDPHHTASILLLDDHSVVADGLKQALNTAGYENVRVTTALEAARDALKQTPPQLLITDISLPDGSGLALAREIKRYMPTVKILFLTMHTDNATLEQAMATEAEGYVYKTTGLAGVLRAVTSLLDGASVYPAGHQPNRYRPRPETPPELTQREEDVLACLGQGQANKEIARTLDMAEGTVKVHIKTILKKLRLRNRTQAAIYAFENGYNPGLMDSA